MTVSHGFFFISNFEAEQATEQRARNEEYDRFTEEINTWTKSIEEVSYTKGKTWQGKDAVRVFGTQEFTAKQLKNIPHTNTFRDIYFLTGRADTLMKDIRKSILSESEKETLLRRIIFVYTEKMIVGVFPLVGQLVNMKNPPAAVTVFIDLRLKCRKSRRKNIFNDIIRPTHWPRAKP